MAVRKFSVGLILFIINYITAINFINAQSDLQFYMNAALKNNPTLKEIANQIKISELDKSLVESEFLYPQISLTANYLFVPYFNNDGKLISKDPKPEAIGYDISLFDGGLYSALINIEKKVFIGGVVNAFHNQSDLRIKNSTNSAEVIKHSLLKDVTEQYLNAFQSQQLYSLAKSVADTLNAELEITRKMTQRGLTKQSDLLLLKIEVDNQKILALQYLNELRKNLSELNSLCGLQDTSLTKLSNVTLNYSPGQIRSNFYKQFTIDSAMVINQQQVFETKYLPQVSIFFNTGLNAVELNDIQKKFGLSAGINFSLPIYDGGQKNIIQQQTQISLRNINAFKENQVNSLINKIKDAENNIEFSRQNLKNISDQINSYEQLLKLARAELTNGQRPMTEYITLIKNFLELKKNELDAEISYQRSINNYNYWNW